VLPIFDKSTILQAIAYKKLKEKFGVLFMSDATKVKQSISNKRNAWFWGFTPQSENWNGRLAMIGFVTVILIEVFSGNGFLHFWEIL
jgi:hypothetical protein